MLLEPSVIRQLAKASSLHAQVNAVLAAKQAETMPTTDGDPGGGSLATDEAT